MAEAFEDDGNALQALAAGIHLGQQGFQLGDDAALLGKWGNNKWDFRKISLIDRNLIDRMPDAFPDFFSKEIGLHKKICKFRFDLIVS